MRDMKEYVITRAAAGTAPAGMLSGASVECHVDIVMLTTGLKIVS